MTDEHLIFTTDKWPDLFEVYQDGQDELKKRVQVVLLRRNSRPIMHEQLLMLQALEDAGVTVRIRVGTIDLTIEQFEKGGVYKARPTISTPGTQAHYNARSQLNKMEQLLSQIDASHPQFDNVAKRVRHLREMLSTVEPTVETHKLVESDHALDRLAKLIEEADANLYTDDKLRSMTLHEVLNVYPPGAQRVALLQRKSKLDREETLNAERKPVDAGQNTSGSQDDVKQPSAVADVDQLP